MGTLFPLNPVGSARWYVTSGQWRADAATFAGMVHLLFLRLNLQCPILVKLDPLFPVRARLAPFRQRR